MPTTEKMVAVLCRSENDYALANHFLFSTLHSDCAMTSHCMRTVI